LPEKIPPILIREAKVHNGVISNLEKFHFDDCEGLISASKDGKVYTLSKGLDIWGGVSKIKDEFDEYWKFPSN